MGVYFQDFTVDGFRCDGCGEEIISRDTALQIDQTVQNLRDLWRDWRIPADTKESPPYSAPSVKTAPGQSLIGDGTNHITR
jgi:hypothetical protein